MEDVDTLKAERAVIESELKSTSPDMKAVFLQAAATGSLNEPLISAQSLGRAFGAFQQQVNKQPGSRREILDTCLYCLSCVQVTESITRQERIIAEVQDLYQPFIQERGGGGGAREDALKSIASVSLTFDKFM